MEYIKAIWEGALLGTKLGVTLGVGVVALIALGYCLNMVVEAVGALALMPVLYSMLFMPKA